MFTSFTPMPRPSKWLVVLLVIISIAIAGYFVSAKFLNLWPFTITVPTPTINNYFQIKEWDVEFQISPYLKGLTYILQNDNTFAVFSTQDLMDLDKQTADGKQTFCDAANVPVGGIERRDKITADDPWAGFYKTVGDGYYYRFVTPQATCSDNEQVQVLEEKIRNELVGSFKSLRKTSGDQNQGSDWKTYTNLFFGYSIRYPPRWSVDNQRSSANEVVFNTGEIDHISISVQPYSKTLNDWKNSLDQSLPFSLKQRTVANQPALQFHNGEMGGDVIGLVYNGKLYRFDSVSDEMLNTFQFIDSGQWTKAQFPNNYHHSVNIMFPSAWVWDCCGDTSDFSAHYVYPRSSANKLGASPFITIYDFVLQDCPDGEYHNCSMDELQRVTANQYMDSLTKYLDKNGVGGVISSPRKIGSVKLSNFTSDVPVYQGISPSNQPAELYLIQSAKGVVGILFQQPQNFDAGFKNEFLNRLISN